MATYTANALLKSTQKLASWRGAGYANSEGLYFMQAIPFRGMRSIVYQWRSKSSPVKRNKDGSMPKVRKPAFYDIYLEFQNIEYADEPLKADGTWAKVEYKGDTYYYAKPTIDTNPIRIRCSCSDFTHRGSYEAYKEGILYGGKYPSYTRKTPPPPEGRPYANPMHVPMMCKHIYAAITRSITEGWVLGSSK